MQKIMITAVAAVLTLVLTACNGAGESAAEPSSPADSAPATVGTPAPEGSGASADKRIGSVWGRLHHLTMGRFIVDDVAFYTSNETVLYVAGGKCPNGSAPINVSKCSMAGFEEWIKSTPHNAIVRFHGQVATLIRETQ